MSDSIRDTFEDGAAALGGELRSAADRASRHIKDGVDAVSESVDEGADLMKDGMRRTRKNVEAASRRVASAVNDSGDYFRENGPRGVMRDVQGLVREHPGKALLAMAAVGYLIGRSLKQRN